VHITSQHMYFNPHVAECLQHMLCRYLKWWPCDSN